MQDSYKDRFNRLVTRAEHEFTDPACILGAAELLAGELDRLNIKVFDVETDLIGKDDSINAVPPEFILGSVLTYDYTKTPNLNTFTDISEFNKKLKYGTIYVGHNVCFDLNYVYRLRSNSTLLWDTAMFHYICTGQKDTFPSLNSLAEYYGISFSKEDKVSEMIKAGISPKYIPFEDLKKYCEQDVLLTWEIFKRQRDIFNAFNKAKKSLIITHMNWLKTVFYSSKTGINVDRDGLNKAITKLSSNVEYLKTCLESTMYLAYVKAGIKPRELDNSINIASPKQVATFIYGGEIAITKYVNTGTMYKSGMKKGTPKLRKESTKIPYNGYFKSYGVLDTSEEALRKLISCARVEAHTEAEEFLSKLLDYRDNSKTLNTYLIPYYERSERTGKIHPEYKHTGTPTGRLSCTKPNIQNLKGD